MKIIDMNTYQKDVIEFTYENCNISNDLFINVEVIEYLYLRHAQCKYYTTYILVFIDRL